MKEIRSGSFVSAPHEVTELLRRNTVGGGAIRRPPWTPMLDSGLGRGLSCGPSCLLSVSVIDEVLNTRIFEVNLK